MFVLFVVCLFVCLLYFATAALRLKECRTVETVSGYSVLTNPLTMSRRCILETNHPPAPSCNLLFVLLLILFCFVLLRVLVLFWHTHKNTYTHPASQHLSFSYFYSFFLFWAVHTHFSIFSYFSLKFFHSFSYYFYLF